VSHREIEKLIIGGLSKRRRLENFSKISGGTLIWELRVGFTPLPFS